MQFTTTQLKQVVTINIKTHKPHTSYIQFYNRWQNEINSMHLACYVYSYVTVRWIQLIDMQPVNIHLPATHTHKHANLHAYVTGAWPEIEWHVVLVMVVEGYFSFLWPINYTGEAQVFGIPSIFQPKSSQSGFSSYLFCCTEEPTVISNQVLRKIKWWLKAT